MLGLRRLWILWFVLCMAHARVGSTAPDPVESEVALRKAEVALLHRRPELSGLLRFDGSKWEQKRPVGDLVVLHLWATTCAPCRKEMPFLRQMVASFADEPALEFALVSEDSEEVLIKWLVDETHKAEMPPGFTYLNTTIRLRASLQNDMQPLTLILDERRVVRHAIAGSLLSRRGELVRAIEELLHSSRGTTKPLGEPTGNRGKGPAAVAREEGPGLLTWQTQWVLRALETRLLHHRLERNVLVPFLSRKPGGNGLFLVKLNPPAACGSCEQEEDRLRRMAKGFPESKVRVISLEGQSGARLLWHDRRGQGHPMQVRDLVSAWPEGWRAGPLHQPIFLVLDATLTIRQAVVGSLAGRSGELAAGVERLLRRR